MIRELILKDFKSFSGPAGLIRFGPFSVLIGTNASGKSNIRDALRFVHGVSRGYALSEIIGEKYIEGGVLQWKGIRGGVRETVTRNGDPSKAEFTITVRTTLPENDGGGLATYAIAVNVGDKTRPPAVANESLEIRGKGVFQVRPIRMGNGFVFFPFEDTGIPSQSPLFLRSDRPALTQLPEHKETSEGVKTDGNAFVRTISSIRFLDLDPNSLRRPSIPGQTILGDKGENLSSVLQAVCADPVGKEALIDWTRELTPLDIVDLKFPEVSLGGQVQLQLVEQGGREISAESASDGTLRFLAFAAAVLGTDPAQCYFFEEVENGIHPNRVHLLVNLLQKATRDRNVQVIGTTHSPALLSFLDEAALGDASLVYRAGPVSRVRALGDIPALRQLPPGTPAGELLSSGWFEDIAAFMESEAGE
ncbi:MAG TPA: ATP-binding protein [Blastocatellia bacterium]